MGTRSLHRRQRRASASHWFHERNGICAAGLASLDCVADGRRAKVPERIHNHNVPLCTVGSYRILDPFLAQETDPTVCNVLVRGDIRLPTRRKLALEATLAETDSQTSDRLPGSPEELEVNPKSATWGD